MTNQEKEIYNFCVKHADWWPSITQIREMVLLLKKEAEMTPHKTTADGSSIVATRYCWHSSAEYTPRWRPWAD